MKKFFSAWSLLAGILFVTSCRTSEKPPYHQSEQQVPYVDSTGRTNNFYDDEPTFELIGPDFIDIVGEVAGTVRIDLDSLPLRSLIVKETLIKEGEVEFVGAYRYDGVSLFDLLEGIQVTKKNADEFKPVIDQYVVIYGAAGDSVVFSWGEIFYPVQLHQILIARKVMRIVPAKTKDQWPLPERTRIIAGSDLVTERNMSEPVKIVVRSIGISYKVDRSVEFWAPEMVLKGIANEPATLSELPAGLKQHALDQVFYGRGRGIHGITQFRGVLMRDLLIERLPLTSGRIKNGLFVIAAIDGYRCSMTYSELMNRNDNAGVILMDENLVEEAGRFSCVFGADFFSDRAIKSITEIRLIH